MKYSPISTGADLLVISSISCLILYSQHLQFLHYSVQYIMNIYLFPATFHKLHKTKYLYTPKLIHPNLQPRQHWFVIITCAEIQWKTLFCLLSRQIIPDRSTLGSAREREQSAEYSVTTWEKALFKIKVQRPQRGTLGDWEYILSKWESDHSGEEAVLVI